MGLREIADAITLQPVTSLDRPLQMRILSIRNQPKVRDKMYSSHEITEGEHIHWLADLKEDASTRFSAVFYKGELVGAVGLKAISLPNLRADWAYYLDTYEQGCGLGPALEFMFLNHVFDEIGLLKLNCEVLGFNERVISLHKKFGFKEEGIRRQHIRRGDDVFDAHLLGVTRSEWADARKNLERRLFK